MSGPCSLQATPLQCQPLNKVLSERALPWAWGRPDGSRGTPFPSAPASPVPSPCHSGRPPSRLFPLSLQDMLGILPVGSPLTSSISSSITSSLAATPPSPAGTSSVPGMNANALPFYPASDTVESVIGNWAVSAAKSRTRAGIRDARSLE